MDILNAIKSLLNQILHNSDTAFLYGSRARGTERADSDWDILVILDKDKIEVSDYDNISYPLCALGWDLDQTISPVLYSKKEWNLQRFTPFYHNVEADAIPLK